MKPIQMFAVVQTKYNTAVFACDLYEGCVDYLKILDPTWSLDRWAERGTRIAKGAFHIKSLVRTDQLARISRKPK